MATQQRDLRIVELTNSVDYEGDTTEVIGIFDDDEVAQAFADVVAAAIPETHKCAGFSVTVYSLRANHRYAPDPALFGWAEIDYKNDGETR